MNPTQSFDVFLSHNSHDKPIVRELKRLLQEVYGLTVWFDEDELRPGIPWQELLEDGITSSNSVVVVVGADGLGPWEDEEMQGALRLAVGKKRPAIPVLLPGAPAQPELPMFLGNRTWVDLRTGFSDREMERLVWGITGRRPTGLRDRETEGQVVPPPSPVEDFVLQIGEHKNADDPFPVELLRSPVGTARNDMPLPFAAVELKSQLQNLKIALLSSHGTHRLVCSKELEEVQKFGALMFEKLIAGDIKEKYEESRRLANRNRRELPIKLCILAPQLATLPWEFLYDAEQNGYLTLSKQTPFVRHLMIADPPASIVVERPLRILGMLSSPRDANFPPLDVERERARIAKALEPLCQRGDVELHWLPNSTVDSLQRALNDGPWHVFHFVGHGGYDTRNREGTIMLENGSGRPLLLTASKLRHLLQDHFSLRLVVLNACDTASGDDDNVFSSMAGELVRRGVPAVVAMQYPISDDAAARFASFFYESLASGKPVTEAVTEGRKAIHLDRDGSIEWGTPVLLSSLSDGQLFQFPARTPAKEVAPPLKKTIKDSGKTDEQVGKEPKTTASSEVQTNPMDSPLWRDVRYWQRAELPVRLLVACNDAERQRRLKSLASAFDGAVPVFEDLINHDHFKTNQSFVFDWQETSPSQLKAEADTLLRQSQTRMVVIVSDALSELAANGSNQPSDLARQLRGQFFSQPQQCGLLALVPGDAHRMIDVDRSLSVSALNRPELRRMITKVADGLRLKTPPGPAQTMASAEAITVRLAQSKGEIDDCLKLRFQVYDRMGYLEEPLENADCELDCFDTNALHFAACTRTGDIVGTVRLILARRIGPNEFPNSVVGLSPKVTVDRQSAWVREVAFARGAILRNKLARPPYFATLPILQSTEFKSKIDNGANVVNNIGKKESDNFGDLMKNVDRSAELSRLVVAPRYRGVGLSKLLVRAVIAVAANLEIRQLLLECVPAHVAMYEGLGFQRIPGTHGRAQELDQVAVGMRLDPAAPMSRARGMANHDLQMIKQGFGKPDPAMLFGTKHLCLCAQKTCWASGHFDLSTKTSCPLCALHRRD